MFQPNEVVVKNIAELSVRNLDSISRHLHSIKIVIFYLETFTSVVTSHISQFGDMSRSDTFTRMMMGDQYGLEFSWPEHGHCEIFGVYVSGRYTTTNKEISIMSENTLVKTMGP